MAKRPDQERFHQVWQRYAPRYDKDAGGMDRMVGDGREWVCSQATGDVLEVAIGTGRNLPFYPPSVRLTGVDFSSAMLEVASQRAKELGVEIDLRECDAQHLEFPDESFDSVVCTLSLCSIPDDRQAIAEFRRVLRPGGRLLLLDHIAGRHWPVRLAQRALEQFTKRVIGEHFTRRQLPLVQAAGFTIERAEQSKLGIIERLVAVKPTS